MKKLLILMIVLVLLPACSQQEDPISIANQTLDASEKSTEIILPTVSLPTNAVTLAPSATPTKTKAPTPTATEGPTNLPDGEYILFVTGYPRVLYAISPEGGEEIQISASRSVEVNSTGQYMLLGYANLLRIDLVTREEKLGNIPEQCSGYVSFSPNGDWAAVSCGQNMSLVSLFSDQTIILTDWEPFSGDTDYFYPDWSPDGTRIAYWADAGFLYPHEASGLYIATMDCYPDFEDCKVETIGPFFSEHFPGTTAWSHDGQKLAVVYDDHAKLINIIDVTNMAVVQRLEISQNPIRSLAWSPDGKFIAYGAEDSLNILSIDDLSISRIFRVSGANDVSIRGWYFFEKFEILDE